MRGYLTLRHLDANPSDVERFILGYRRFPDPEDGRAGRDNWEVASAFGVVHVVRSIVRKRVEGHVAILTPHLLVKRILVGEGVGLRGPFGAQIFEAEIGYGIAFGDDQISRWDADVMAGNAEERTPHVVDAIGRAGSGMEVGGAIRAIRQWAHRDGVGKRADFNPSEFQLLGGVGIAIAQEAALESRGLDIVTVLALHPLRAE